MKKAARGTVRRASRKPKTKSLANGTAWRRRPRPALQKKRVLIPKLYVDGLILSIVLFSVSLISVAYQHDRPAAAPSSQSGTSLNALFGIPVDTAAAETWTISDQPILENVTGTSTIVLPDGTIAMYFERDGTIWRATSSDGVAFSQAESTGIADDPTIPYVQRPVVGKPSVLQVASHEFIMVYEQSVRQQASVPQIDQPRNLFLARSADGLAFTPSGIIVDSSRDDAGWATDPDLVVLPDTTLRLFYVSKSDRVASLHSDDDGRTWVHEGERLPRISYDPDLTYVGSNYVLYYAYPGESVSGTGTLQSVTQIRKALSADGLTFEKTAQTLITGASLLDAADPDVITQPDGTVRMYFGLLRPGTGAGNLAYDLYTATAAVK